jgi:elongation factor 2
MAEKESRVERMKRLSRNQKNIRNIATSAHIHHGKCVAPHTRLTLSDGQLRTAEELYLHAERIGRKVRQNEQETVYDISGAGITAFSLNKETGLLEKKEISHAWKLAGGTAIKLSLRNGLEVTTTPEHKYIILEDMDFIEKEARELKLGDRVVCARELKAETAADIREHILLRLAALPCYAKLAPDSGKLLLRQIQREGLPRIAEQLGVKPKSFYHGCWQNRYRVGHLLALGKRFGISTAELYASIDSIAFRTSTKNTARIRLPNDVRQFFFLAGLMAGDGSGHRFVAGKPPTLAKAFADACKGLGVKASPRSDGIRTPELATNKALLLLLHALFDYPLKQKSHNIRVSDFLARAPDDCVAAFLRAYFDCDGTVEEGRRAVSVTSVSGRMLSDLQLLLLRFGCVGIRQGDTLYLSGLSARRFAERIGFSLPEKQEKAEHLARRSQGSIVADVVPLSTGLAAVRKVPMASIDHHYYKYEQGTLKPAIDTVLKLKEQFALQQLQTTPLDRLTTGDLAFIEVAALEAVHEPIVYDFSVPGHRNFVAEGMVIHNTALTDNLLAAAGYMSEQAAGSLEKGMATWQHSDEQERLMTVDAANVSMVHTYGGEDFLINLIDTPGHIDFGGNVTRAMRAIDGTVVLVCASEGIMPQTETVLKQALRERVKPVLFINKVDRLINEQKYTAEQIQKRFTEIVLHFNRLIESIAEPEFKQKWKVNFQDGSVAFGSARENWALSLPFMQKKGVGFKDIIKMYEMSPEQRKDWVWKNAALYEVLLDIVVKHLPNPAEAQKYRIPKIWRGDPESEFGKDLVNCNPNGKVAFVITRILIDQKSGREISAGRLYSGTIKDGMQVYLNNAKQQQRVAQVLMYDGIKTEIMEEIPAGNVIALMGISGTAGETITEAPEQPFEELKHIFEPVITKAIEPAKPADLSKLVEVLKKVAKEDPSVKIEINPETGENLMSGMGELHLEIIENRIKTEKNVDIRTSPPIVVYRETVGKKGPSTEGKSPNKHNKIYIYVEPLEPHVRELIKSGELPEGRTKKRDLKIRDTLVDAGYDNDTALAVRHVYKGNLFIDKTKGVIQISEVMELLLDGFEQVMDQGPLAREPCFGVKVVLDDIKLHEDAIHRGPAQIYPAVRESIRGSMMQAGATMFEPVQTHVIEAPLEYTGDVTKLVMSKRGQVLELNQEGHQLVCKARLPVAEMLGWSSDLRSATGGRGVSSLADQVFERLPSELQDKVVRQIRDRKGLTEGQVGA